MWNITIKVVGNFIRTLFFLKPSVGWNIDMVHGSHCWQMTMAMRLVSETVRWQDSWLCKKHHISPTLPLIWLLQDRNKLPSHLSHYYFGFSDYLPISCPTGSWDCHLLLFPVTWYLAKLIWHCTSDNLYELCIPFSIFKDSIVNGYLISFFT